LSLLAMVDGLLGVRNGFGDMILLRERNLRHQKESGAKAKYGGNESSRHVTILLQLQTLSTNSIDLI